MCDGQEQPEVTAELLKSLMRDFAAAVQTDLASHKVALVRLNENQQAQQKTFTEVAEMVNRHEAMLAELSRAVEKLRSLLQPPLSN